MIDLEQELRNIEAAAGRMEEFARKVARIESIRHNPNARKLVTLVDDLNEHINEVLDRIEEEGAA